VVIIEVDVATDRLTALVGTVVRQAVDAFAKQSLDQPFGLAIRLGRCEHVRLRLCRLQHREGLDVSPPTRVNAEAIFPPLTIAFWTRGGAQTWIRTSGLQLLTSALRDAAMRALLDRRALLKLRRDQSCRRRPRSTLSHSEVTSPCEKLSRKQERSPQRNLW